MAGLFIVGEGLDTSGKSTQLELLKAKIQEQYPDKKVILTKEPGSPLNGIASKIRDILLHTDEDICSDAETFLYAADRSQHVHQLKKLLEEDYIILCDRYFYTSVVYQAIAGTTPMDRLLEINELAINGLVPDLLFTIHITADEFYRRSKKRDSLDRIESKGRTFFEKAASGYYECLPRIIEEGFDTMLPKNSIDIDGTRSIQENADTIWHHVQKLIK